MGIRCNRVLDPVTVKLGAGGQVTLNLRQLGLGPRGVVISCKDDPQFVLCQNNNRIAITIFGFSPGVTTVVVSGIDSERNQQMLCIPTTVVRLG